jgi:saxitoxin biosynthesis operon SxtJ-like protein
MKTRASDTHERVVADEEVAGSSDRAFGLVFSLLSACLAMGPLVRGRPVRGWALVVAALFLLAALVRPAALAPLNRIWLKAGLLLHACVSPVIMALIFYTTVTPLGLLRRLLGHDPLRLRLDPDAVTYWIERDPPGPTPERMRRQF